MTDDSDEGGGFRWNLKPGGGDEPATPVVPAVPVVPAKPAESAAPVVPSKPVVPAVPAVPAVPVEAVESVKTTAFAVATPHDPATARPNDSPSFLPESAVVPGPENAWDVPTAASPVIARSVFPLPPPAGVPALLPPPYVPPPLIPPPYVPPLDNSLRGISEPVGSRPFGLPDVVDESPQTESTGIMRSAEPAEPATPAFGTSDIEVLLGGAKFIDYSAPAVQADTPTTAMPSENLPSPPPQAAHPPLSATAMARPLLPATPTTTLPATTVLPAGLSSISSPPFGSLPFESLPFESPPFGSLPPLSANALALYVPPKPVSAHAMPRQQKILLGVAAGLVALLALVALFLLGTRIGGPASAPETPVAPSVAPDTTPTLAPATGIGPVAVGDHAFDELLGGECLALYESPWQETYTVVDCGQPHPAQMLARSTLPDAAGVAYPAIADLQASTTLACTAATVVDYASAGEFDDIEISASFPSTAEQWAAGDRTYYCFASRSGGGDLTASIAVPAA